MRKSIYTLCTMLAFASCTSELGLSIDGQAADANVVCINACQEQSLVSKNIIDNTTLETTWLSGDAINVFFGASESSKFVTAESGGVAQFKGSIDVVTGGGEGLDDNTSLWGIYPYNSANTCDGTYVTLNLPSEQSAAENTFANGLFPQIARSRNFYMTFYNLCGCIRFTVVNPDIRKVQLLGNNQEPIAGRAKISLEKVPQVEEILSAQTKLTMTAPDGGYFKPGVNYYFVLYPTEFSKGLTVKYYKSDSVASYTYSESYNLSRNKVSRFKDRDSGLTFEPISLNDWEEGDKIQGEI